VPAVDFAQELILVEAAPSHRVELHPVLDGKGNLGFSGAGILPTPGEKGFAYHLLVIRREGVRTINGQPLGGRRAETQ
jgi:hypothetical protein